MKQAILLPCYTDLTAFDAWKRTDHLTEVVQQNSTTNL